MRILLVCLEITTFIASASSGRLIQAQTNRDWVKKDMDMDFELKYMRDTQRTVFLREDISSLKADIFQHSDLLITVFWEYLQDSPSFCQSAHC
jgi:hypothetical protein